MHITFITGNPNKAEQLSAFLDHDLAHRSFDLTEIQSLDLEEIVRHKAQEAYGLVGSPVLVEDVSLTFPALGRLPGPLVKWFLKELGNDGLCRLLGEGQERTAVAESAFALYDGTGLRIFRGTASGSVPTAPRGNLGFGWDAAFVPEGSERTWGEMTLEERQPTSMRNKALIELKRYLTSL